MRVLLLGNYRDVEARMDAATGDLLARVGREGTTLSLRAAGSRGGGALRSGARRVGRRRTSRRASSIAARATRCFSRRCCACGTSRATRRSRRAWFRSGVRDVIRQRLDRVAAETRALIDLAAVAGDVIDAPLLAAAAGRDAAWVSARLAEAGRAGVLAERGGRRRFGHALFREVLYRELAEGERRALHGRVADALGAAGARRRLAEIAHHTLEGPPEMLGRAVEHAVRAGGARAGAARLRRGGRACWPARGTR